MTMEMKFKTYSEFKQLDERKDQLLSKLHQKGTSFFSVFKAIMLPRYLTAEVSLSSFVPIHDKGTNGDIIFKSLEKTLDYILLLSKTKDILRKEDALHLWSFWTDYPRLRNTPIEHLIDKNEETAEPQYLEEFLTTTFDWFSASSITNMHPIEQCCLMTMRMSDILPFQFWNFYLIRIIPWFYLLKEGYSPPLFNGKNILEWFQCMKKAHHFYTSNLTLFYLREAISSLNILLSAC